MKSSWSIAILLAAGVLAAPFLVDSVVQAQEEQQTKRRDRGPSPSASKVPKGPSAFREKSPSGERSQRRFKPEVGREPRFKRPPTVEFQPPAEVRRAPRVKRPPIAERRRPPAIRHARRPWRPGLRYRWVVVPTIIIAEELEWCHYHLYRVRGMRFHRNVECHQHIRWDHPSIRYVEEY